MRFGLLRPPALVDAILKPVMTEATVRTTFRDEVMEGDPDLARGLSWLLRKHFESHLRLLRAQGFIIEPDRRTNRRAYFVGENSGPGLLVYDTPNRRGVAREVVKQTR